MSDDIVKRLRAAGHNALMDEAADEIERLTAERDHWKGLVARADLVLFPFEG